jgi:hypothetical protein
VTADVGNEPESAAGGRLPLTWANSATVAHVVAIGAGVLTTASGLLMWRVVGYTAANLSTGVSFEPNSITNGSVLLSLAPGGAGALVAVIALALRGRARWLRYLQIGLWLLALAGLVYIADTCAPLIGLGPLYGQLAVGDISGVVTIVLLTRSLRRPASRRPRWHLAVVLLTVTVQNQAGQIVASQRLPFRTSGARYRMRLPRGTYSINVVSAQGGSAGDTVYVPADETNEEDFNDPGISSCVLLHLRQPRLVLGGTTWSYAQEPRRAW